MEELPGFINLFNSELQWVHKIDCNINETWRS